MTPASNHPLNVALQWHLDVGVDEALSDTPQDRTAMPPIPGRDAASGEGQSSATRSSTGHRPLSLAEPETAALEVPGAAAARQEAEKLAKAATTLDELRAALEGFDGLTVKKTATQMVFADGNASSPVMIISEAPGADEDRAGLPFAGPSGQLLDKILACIGLSRTAADTANAVYLSTILNWRPPGNRTPSAAEIDIAMPFIERHIALVRPKLLILCGVVPARALLARTEGISKLRGTFYDYTPQTEGIAGGDALSIPALCTYHPASVQTTPSQKKAVWADMLMLQDKLREIDVR